MSKEIIHLTDWHTTENGLCIAIRNLTSNYPLHWHDYFEIEYVLSGSGTCVINEIEHNFKKGDMFFLTPSDIEEVRINEGDNVKLINISFNMSWISNEIYSNLSYGTIIYDYPTFLLDRITDEYVQHDAHNIRCIRYLLNCILIDIIRHNSKNQDNTYEQKYSEHIHKALKYIHVHFRENITQTDVAYNIGLSRNYFCSKFHSEVGVSFKGFLNDLRLKYSLSLLVNSDLSITEVCMHSGFNDFSNYFHIFKRRYKMSPLQYRKAFKEKDNMEFEPVKTSHYRA